MKMLLDPANAETRIEFGMAEAEVAQRAQWRASAAVFAAIDSTLREAAAHPEIFVDARMLRGDAIEFAERAAAADLAVRLNLAESTVRSHGHVASTLRERLPVLWAWFSEGEVSTQNAREAASIAIELPDAAWSEFDAQILDAARTLAPARFRNQARAIREKLHATTLAERHDTARQRRGVWTEVDRDGMGWMNAYLATDSLALITAQLDALAFDLFTEPDENRTMSQLRADALADLLVGAGASVTPSVTVALTIPVLTLLGHADEPAILEGVGPIDLDTARRLAAGAPSITRLLTDPVSGAVVQMDPKQYRTSAALKRWFGIQHATCDFPGCGRRAANCDLDHTTAWADDGRQPRAEVPQASHHEAPDPLARGETARREAAGLDEPYRPPPRGRPAAILMPCLHGPRREGLFTDPDRSARAR